MKHVAMRRIEDRKWELRWTVTDPSGRRCSREQIFHGTKKATQEEVFRIELEINGNQPVYQTKLTLQQWLEQWMVGKAAKRPETFEHYMEQIEYILDYPIAKVELQRLNALVIDGFFNTLRGRQTKYGRRLSSGSVDHVWAVMNNCLNHAVRLDLIPINPMSKLKREAVEPVKPTRILAGEECLAYIRAADLDAEYGPLAHFAMDTSCRREDLAGLPWSAIDLESGRVQIKQVAVWTKQGGIEFQEPKTRAGLRDIYISDKTVAALRKWKTRQDIHKQAWQDRYTDIGLVFPRLDGKLATPGNIYGKVQRFLKRHGLPMIKLHEIRHTSLTNLLEAGHDAKAVSVRAGHSDPRTTMRLYRHVREAEKKKMGQVYDRMAGLAAAPENG